jgi:hypothetical protein
MELMQPSEYVSEFFLTAGVRRKSFVLVEGTTDRALWTEYAADDCHLLPARGKDIIIDVLNTPMLQGAQGIAGIVDSDYWLIAQADELGTVNLLYDDCCPDMELILLRSPALKKVLRNHLYNYDVDKIHDLAKKLTKESQRLAAEIGYFRLLNHREEFGLRFRDLQLSEYIDTESLLLDCARVANRLTADKSWISSEELLEQVEALKEDYRSDNIQLCRGHDVVSIMAIIMPILFQAEFGDEMPQGMSARDLSRNLRMAYEFGYFRQTSLFDSIQEWEHNNSPYTILKSDI